MYACKNSLHLRPTSAGRAQQPAWKLTQKKKKKIVEPLSLNGATGGEMEQVMGMEQMRAK
jgi:hypothetical protein